MTKLHKHLNLIDLTLLSTSTIIGGGIFTILSTSTLYSGKYTWIAVLLSGIISLLSGLSYSKLASLFNDNSSEYNFIHKAFSKKLANISSVILVLGIIFAASIVSIGFGNYLSSIVSIHPKILSLIATTFFGFINLIQNKTLIQFNNKTAILEILTLVIISGVAIFKSNNTPFPLPTKSSIPLSGIIHSTFLLSFAYWGYETILASHEESIQPKKDIPKAIIYSIVFATIVYTLLAASTTSLLSKDLLSKSKYPIVHLAQHLFGNIGYYAVSILAVIALGNGIVTMIMSGSRLLQRITSKLDIVKQLHFIDSERKTPDNSIITVTIISLLCILCFSLEPLVNYANIMWFIILILTNMSAIKLNVIHPLFPMGGIIFTLLLIFFNLQQN